MRIALAKLLLAKAQSAAARRADQPSRSRSAQLAGRVSARISVRLRADLARPVFSRRHREQDVEIWNKRMHLLHRQLRQVSVAEDASGERNWKPPTATSVSASSNLKSSSTASATRLPRQSRCRAASKNWKRSSGSRFPRRKRRSTSRSRSPSQADESWQSSRVWPRVTVRSKFSAT